MTTLSDLQFEKPKPISFQILDRLRDLIRSGEIPSGSKLPATKELAQLWQTNVNAVHNALVALVKEGLLIRHPGIGTFVRQRTEKLACVGIYHIRENWTKGTSDFELAIHGAIADGLDRLGIRSAAWIDSRPAAERGTMWNDLLRAAQRREIQGLIVTAMDWPHVDWLEKLPIPVACVAAMGLPNEVSADLPQLAELSLRALARQGCRSVGLICPVPVTVTHPDRSPNAVGEFYERFTDLASDLRLTVRNEWVRVGRAENPIHGNLGQQQFGHEEFRRLWAQRERPDGLLVWPDTVARGVILGLLEQQVRVPAELKLVLHKNEAVDLYCPMPVTFAVLRERELARALILQVQKQFRGEPVESVRWSFHIAESKSVAAPPPNDR